MMFSVDNPSVVHLQEEGEKQRKERIQEWKEFLIPLFDGDGTARQDENGNNLAAIAYNPADMHSKVFLTRPDEHGDVKRARVVEMLKDFDKNLESDKDRQRFVKDLKYQVVYDRPSQQNKKRTDDPSKMQHA